MAVDELDIEDVDVVDVVDVPSLTLSASFSSL